MGVKEEEGVVAGTQGFKKVRVQSKKVVTWRYYCTGRVFPVDCCRYTWPA